MLLRLCLPAARTGLQQLRLPQPPRPAHYTTMQQQAEAPAAGSSSGTAAPRRLVNSFLPASGPLQSDLYLIVLNYTLPRLTAALWKTATMRVCADGGANRLFDELPAMLGLEGAGGEGAATAARRSHLPDVIKGDMDSVRRNVVDYYSSQGVPLVDLSSDQDTTDLTKCVMYVEQQIAARRAAAAAPLPGGGGAPAAEGEGASGIGRPGPGGTAGSQGGHHHQQQQGQQQQQQGQQQRDQQEPCILVLGALGGRLDHTLANLNTLYSFPHLDLVLAGDGNLVRLLRAGRSELAPDTACEGPTCALVPLAGPVTGTSSGLKWDLQGTEMRFRGLISTSNLLATPGSPVAVDCDGDVLWITEFRDLPRGSLSSADGG